MGVLVNMVKNLWVLISPGNFLNSSTTVVFSRRIVFNDNYFAGGYDQLSKS